MAVSPPSETLQWWEGRLIRGHGVASGRSPGSPYPAGSIALQSPHFLARGLDLRAYQSATLNLEFSPGVWQLQRPHHHLPELRWTDRHPPETFSFWHCRLRRLETALEIPALIYHPHPETKRAHHQSASILELLAVPLGPLRVGERFSLGVDPQRCLLTVSGPEAAVLRHKLLEFLKFRVLAAQQQFFADLEAEAEPLGGLRCWLAQQWPMACRLSDADLQRTLDQARLLYTEEPRLGGP